MTRRKPVTLPKRAIDRFPNYWSRDMQRSGFVSPLPQLQEDET